MANPFFAVNDKDLDKVTGGRYVGPTFVYLVQENDTLPLLAQRFGTTVRVLRELNSIQNPDHFRPGMRLLIPQR